MQPIFRDPLFRRIGAATLLVGTLGSFMASLALSVSLWAFAVTAIGALISLAFGFLLAASTLAHRQLGAAHFWKVALQNYLVLNAINAALVFFMTADPTRQFVYGLVGLAILSPLAVGASWFTQAAVPKPA